MRSVKEILAENLRRAMDARPDVDTPAKLAKRATWPRGSKAGDHISARQVGYALDARKTAPAPTIDFLEAVARALQMQPWELITDNSQTRREILDRILSVSAVPDSRLTGSAFDATSKIRKTSRR